MAAVRRKKRVIVSLKERDQIRRLTLMDNDFMNIALEGNIQCVQEMLRVILKKDDLVVKTVQTQRFLKGFMRSVYLDIYAVDSRGTIYNIEIQQDNEGADPRRPRFHGAMLDTHSLKAGDDFKNLPECYVIFITRNDVIGLGKTLYVIHKYIDGELLPFDDGSHLIYINGAAKDDGTELWKLVHDLQCADPDEMYFPRLAARVKFLKEDEKGVTVMSSYFENLRKESAEAARKAERENFALKLIKRGKDTIDEIADCTGLTLRRVKALAKSVSA